MTEPSVFDNNNNLFCDILKEYANCKIMEIFKILNCNEIDDLVSVFNDINKLSEIIKKNIIIYKEKPYVIKYINNIPDWVIYSFDQQEGWIETSIKNIKLSVADLRYYATTKSISIYNSEKKLITKKELVLKLI